MNTSRKTGQLSASLLVTVILSLTLFDAYSIRAGDIFTDSLEELFFDSSEDELSMYQEQFQDFPVTESNPEPEAFIEYEAGQLNNLSYVSNELEVTVTEPGNLNEDFSLSLLTIDKNDPLYLDILQTVQQNTYYSAGGIEDMLLFCFLIRDSEGNPVEFPGKAQVTFTFRNPSQSCEDVSDPQIGYVLPPIGREVAVLRPDDLRSSLSPGDSAAGLESESELPDLISSSPCGYLDFAENNRLCRAGFETARLDKIAFVWKDSDSDSSVTNAEIEEIENFFPEEPELTSEPEDAEMDAQAVLPNGRAEGLHTSILDNIPLSPDPGNEWQIVSGQYGTNDVVSTLQTTEDKLFRYQKAILPTDVENEFLVYLNVEPRMWRLSEWENNLDIWVIGEKSGNTGEIIYLTNPLNALQVKNDANSGQAAKICRAGEDSTQYSTSKNKIKTVHHIQLMGPDGSLIREFPVNLSYALTQNSKNAFAILVAPAGTAYVPNQGYPYTLYSNIFFIADTNGGDVGILKIPSTDKTDMPGTYSSMYAKAKPYEITNIPFINDNGEEKYVEITECLSSTGPSAPTLTDEKLTWTDFQNDISSSNPGDFDEIYLNNDIYVYRKNAYELLYKVRLNVDAPGFQSSAQAVLSNNNAGIPYDVIATQMTQIEYSKNSADIPGDSSFLPLLFPTPQIRGLLYNIEYLKLDEFQNPLPGISFTAACLEPVYIPPVTATAVSGDDGYLKFTNLPCGTYSIDEMFPPGYTQGAPPDNFTVCYTNASADERKALFSQDGSNALYDNQPEMHPIVNKIERTDHTVQKIWKNDKEAELNVELNASFGENAPPGDVNLADYLSRFVFQSADFDQPDLSYTEYKTLTLRGNNDTEFTWTYTWENLPKYYVYHTNEGDSITYYKAPIIYSVEEHLPADVSSKYTVSITESDDGLTTTITNTGSQPELPSTGGKGISFYLTAGILLILTSLYLIYTNEKEKRL